jgi:hypothetical protein
MITKIKPLDEIKAELEEVRAKNSQGPAPEPTRRDWYGLVYLGKDGYCSISTFEDGEEKPVCLGRSIEFIPYLRDQGIDGNNVDKVLAAHKKFQAEQKVAADPHQNHPTPAQHNKEVGGGPAGHRINRRNNPQSCNHRKSRQNPLKHASEAKNRALHRGGNHDKNRKN